MRLIFILLLLSITSSVYALQNCVWDATGHQICTTDTGSVIPNGTNANGSTTVQQGCVTNGLGQICTDASGTISGTDSKGNPIYPPNCFTDPAGGILCDPNPTPTQTNPTPTNPTPTTTAGQAGQDGSPGVGGKGGTGGKGGKGGTAGAAGVAGTGDTSTINLLPDFLTPLYTAFTAFCSWLIALLFKVLASVFMMLKDVVMWSFDQFLILLTAILGGVSMASITNLIPALSIPPEVMNIMGLLGLGDCFAILIAAFSIRIVLQLIPFVRLGS